MNFTLFETTLGFCAISWSAKGITFFQLPEKKKNVVLARLAQQTSEIREAPPPASVSQAITRISRHFTGDLQDFRKVKLDLSTIPAFHRKIYSELQQIPAGKTITYGELAELAGSPGASRAAGQAMARNPLPILIPCHRVLRSDGSLGGFSGPGGTDQKMRLLEIEGVQTGKSPAAKKEKEIQQVAKAQGNLPFDARKAITHLCRVDSTLARVIRKAGPCTLEIDPLQSPYEALFASIVYQQLTAKAAATILARVVALFGTEAFPDPGQVLDCPEEKLRSAGLSGGKIAAIRDLSAKFLDGKIPAIKALKKMSDQEIISHLTSIRGIGQWTVEMLLIFRLGRPDVLPGNDYGIRKGFAIAFQQKDLPTPKQLIEAGKRWAPYRTIASWYLWRATEFDAFP